MERTQASLLLLLQRFAPHLCCHIGLWRASLARAGLTRARAIAQKTGWPPSGPAEGCVQVNQLPQPNIDYDRGSGQLTFAVIEADVDLEDVASLEPETVWYSEGVSLLAWGGVPLWGIAVAYLLQSTLKHSLHIFQYTSKVHAHTIH